MSDVAEEKRSLDGAAGPAGVGGAPASAGASAPAAPAGSAGAAGVSPVGEAGVTGQGGAGAAPASVDWEELRALARAAMARAYAPYSGFPVGAAALVADGRTVTGCNVENASYGVGLCAECGLVSDLAATGGGRLTAFTCVGGGGEGRIVAPCGRCRQLLWEHGGAGLLVEAPSGVRPLSELLPDAFGAGELG